MSNSWIGLLAAAGMDPAISARLTAPISELLKTPKSATKIGGLGSDAAFTDGPALARQVMTDVDTFADVIREVGLKFERRGLPRRSPEMSHARA